MTINTNRYEEAAAELAGLPRVERFERLIEFPTRHMFKLIGRKEGLCGAVRGALGTVGYEEVVLVERPSSKGRYISLTFEIAVPSAEQLDRLYRALEQLPGLSLLL